MKGGSGVVLPAALTLVLGLLDPVQSVDDRVQQVVQGSRSPRLDQVVRGATAIVRPPTVLALTLGIAIWGGPAGLATARRAVLAMVPANVAVEGLKRLIDRPRPDGERRRSNSSFPSSHAANAFALAWVFGRRWRRLSVPFWLLAAAVGWSRMYLNRHFLSDVLCGAVIGVACSWIVDRWIRSRVAGQGPGPEVVPGPR